ncbi:hypothetical protein V5G24_24130 [Xanthobacter sp. VTT E-85241]|uniref:outer membrane protein n=1 Tax=Roseixanthobacter finlandensis TaxID=3119922 RepID=UPI003726F999
MNRTFSVLAIAGALAAIGPSGGANAQSTSVPNSGFFVGAGASFNSTQFTDQLLYSQGVSRIYQGGVQVGAGSAGGAVIPDFGNASTFAGTGQAGYFQHLQGSDWLWGAKVSYNYLGASAENKTLAVPQAGSFTGSSPDSFSGNVVVQSYTTSVTNQLALIPFVGRSFEKSFVYLGAGPTLSQVKHDMNGTIGFAAINGSHFNITGTPANFSSSQWVLGGAAVVGATYFFAQTWFLDLSYTYAVTQTKTNTYGGPFSSSTDGYDDIGILSGYFSGGTTTHALTISLNKTF